jgi:radical SAM superfamily enzyme YgiQ (UPF0313 family)
LSALLKENGHQTDLVHLHGELGLTIKKDDEASYQKVFEALIEKKPDLIGITATSFEYEVMNDLAAYVKKQGVNVPIVLGGAHPTFCPEDYRTSNFDAFCVGEGELAMLELCKRMDDKSYLNGNGFDLKKMFSDNPSWLNKSVYPDAIPDPIPLTDVIEDMDSIPLVDRGLFDFDTVMKSRNGWVDIVTGRGCPFPCTFCCNHVFSKVFKKSKNKNRGHRQRSVESVMKELEDLHQQYPEIKIVFFQEDFLNYNRQWMMDFCEEYKKRISIPFYMCARPGSIDMEMAKALKEASCFEVSLGIETGSDFIRNKIFKKGISDESIYTATSSLRDYGINVFANIMLGAPHESYETLNQSVKMMSEVNPALIRVTILQPLRGTDIHNYVKENNLFLTDFSNVQSLFAKSSLKFDDFNELELQRFRNTLGWRINIMMNNAGSPTYKELLKAVEMVDLEKWTDIEFNKTIVKLDDEISNNMMELGIKHYRYFNGEQEMSELEYVKRFKLCVPTVIAVASKIQRSLQAEAI